MGSSSDSSSSSSEETEMREKPTCNLCFKSFTRRANLLRHMREIHNVLVTGMNNVSPFVKKRTAPAQMFSQAMQSEQPVTKVDKDFQRFHDTVKISSEYANSKYVLDTIDNLNAKVYNYQNQIASIRLHNWLIPKTEIRGLSGYLCRRCNRMGFSPIRDIGFDRTMKARHTCDENRIKSIKMVSIDPIVTWDSYHFTACRILESLNDIIPGQKYLVSEDRSIEFDYLERLIHPDVAKILLGIEERYYYYVVPHGQRPEWLSRVVQNIGKKISVEDYEIRDFLRRVTSTYAIFEIPSDKSIKRILIKITN